MSEAENENHEQALEGEGNSPNLAGVMNNITGMLVDGVEAQDADDGSSSLPPLKKETETEKENTQDSKNEDEIKSDFINDNNEGKDKEEKIESTQDEEQKEQANQEEENKPEDIKADTEEKAETDKPGEKEEDSKEQEPEKEEDKEANVNNILNNFADSISNALEADEKQSDENNSAEKGVEPTDEDKEKIEAPLENIAATRVSGLMGSDDDDEPEKKENLINNVANAFTEALTDENKEDTKENKEEEEKNEGVIAGFAEQIANKLNGEEEDKNENTTEKDAVQVGNNDNDVLITMVESPKARPETAKEEEQQPEPEDEQEAEGDPEPEDDEPDLPPIPVNKFTDEELQAALTKQLKTKQLPPLDMRRELIQYTRKQSIQYLINEDYDYAAKLDEAIEANMISLQQDHLNYETEQQNMQLSQRLDEAKTQQQQITEKWNNRIAKFKEDKNNKLIMLQQNHDNQRRMFEGEWSRPEALLPFNKPSPELLQIRKQQKALAISRDFAKAKQLKLAGDAMQKEETAIANRKATEAMKTAYAQLLEKQEKEIQCFMEYGQRRLTQLEQDREKELNSNENLRRQLDSRLSAPKTLKRPTVTIPQVTTRGGERSNSVCGVITNRTRSHFATYKKATEKTRLDIKFSDVTKITKPMTPSPRKGRKNLTFG